MLYDAVVPECNAACSWVIHSIGRDIADMLMHDPWLPASYK
jgi:hypothetical protein